MKTSLIARILVSTSLVLAPLQALAHHGVAGVGVGGLEGPGAPVESANSSNIPAGTFLTYGKLDYAMFKRVTENDNTDAEADYSQFWMLGAGYGFAPWLSGYVFVPYNAKIDEPGGFDTRGFADISALLQFGFKYDEGFKINPDNESLDDLHDWHFTVFGGSSIPTGNPNLADASGAIRPGKSTGFGQPSLSVGLTATKMATDYWTFNGELSYIHFISYRYADANVTQFGAERRLNLSGFYRAFTDMENSLRLDAGVEVQHLGIDRDVLNGAGQASSGGNMVYLVPGARFYWKRVSAAFGVKVPTLKWLNEVQQGSEGMERFRLLFTLSLII